MAWSRFQNDIFQYATSDTTSSFVVSAVAGSGKTTTSLECARRICASNPGYKILFLAFNKNIVEKLKISVTEPGIRCSTLHSFGYSALTRSKLKFCFNEKKWFDYITKNIKRLLDGDIAESKHYMFIKNCENLLRLCRINMVTPGDTDGVMEICSRHSIEPLANECEAVAELLIKCNNVMLFKKGAEFEIDYTDMLCIPLSDAWRRFIPKFDVVFIDEAQDLSKAQQELMLSAVKKGGRFIAVGDPFQSITGFAGAMSNSFSRLEEIAGKTLPLSVCYRCGKNIVNEAAKIVPQIEAAENAADGEIVHLKDMSGCMKGDMVICRKTAPLITLALNMWKKQKSAYIKGNDIAQGLREHIWSIQAECAGKFLTLELLYETMAKRLMRLKAELQSRNIFNYFRHPKYVALAEKNESILALGTYCTDVQDLLDIVDKIFTDSIMGDVIMLSTVHKAKGLEADRVWIICPELLPMTWKDQQQWEREQEMNLKYVALTRAKSSLFIVDVDEKSVDEIKI